ncbi:MFS transporter [Pantoea sp. A4]|uniref:MFS transporter n=1 Tax=Pantoea sp. A4 TaxID=1225184 RepID=UPI00035D9D57|nr:MFS transporter [Pantoea sp. A4]
MKASIGSSTVAWLSFATMFVIGTDTFIVAPLLPTLSGLFQIDPAISGWMVSAYALGYACFALISGPVSDFANRRTVLLLGLIAFSLTTALCGFATGFWSMIIFRFLAGVSAAFVSPQIWASIPLLVPRESIIKTMGAATAGLAIAQIVGIPVGSYLAILSWKYAFWALGGASLLLLFLLAGLFPSLPGNRGQQAFSFTSSYRHILQNSTLKAYLLGYLIFQTGNFEAISFFGSWLFKDFGLDVTAIGRSMIAIGVGNAIGSLWGTRLVKYIGLPRSLLISFLLLVVLYALTPFASTQTSAVAILTIIMMVAGFAFALFMGTLQSQADGARGTVSSLANACMYIGATLGGIVGGQLLQRFAGFSGVATFTVICYLLSFFIYNSAGAFKARATQAN